MPTSLSYETLCAVVEEALLTASNKSALSAPVHRGSAMRDPAEWDSLSFVIVFTAISEAFGVELDDDDAIHFTSIEAIHDFLAEIMVA
jgi:hypothetical protein